MLPCLVTCWTLCFGSPDSVGDKIVLVLFTVACVACNAILRQSAVAQSEAQNMLAREQNERIKFLQCHAQPTMQMVRETALRIIQLMSSKGFVCNCDLSTRDFAAIASFSSNGSISHIERFMRVDDFEIAEFYGADESSLDTMILRFMFEDAPFKKDDMANPAEFMRRMGRFVLKVTVPVYGTADRFFVDEADKKVWIMDSESAQPLLTIDYAMLCELVELSRWDSYSRIVTWAYNSGLLSLRNIAASTPNSRWNPTKTGHERCGEDVRREKLD